MHFNTRRFSRLSPRRLLLSGVLFCLSAAGAEYPPLAVEISPEHPLFLFQDLPVHRSDPDRQREHVMGAWAQMPESLQSNAMIKIEAPSEGEAGVRHLTTVLAALQEQQIPTVVQISGDPQRAAFAQPLDVAREQLEALLRAHTMAKGVEVAGLDFRYYSSPRMYDGQTPTVVAWLSMVLDTAARYGRFVYLPMDELQWARVMSNTACAPLYRQLLACRDYVIPACLTRGDHLVSNQSAVLGLWLEGAVANWGMAADARWYTDVGYAGLSHFGTGAGPEIAPSSLYRAMILSGAMTGATVYSFENGDDLWYGPSRRYWDESILPSLREVVDKAVIARREFVARRTQVGLQLAPSANPEDFHLNLKDIDGVFDEGNLMRAAYGLPRPGQIAELIPDKGDLYWIPLLSPHASGAPLETFKKVFTVGSVPNAAAWEQALAPFRQAHGSGTAFVTEVGRGIFVMNTQENIRAQQPFTITGVPVPLRKFSARRDGSTVVVSWGFRENDLNYRVYKRVLPETNFTLVARQEQEQLQFADNDVPADQSIAYAVTALTDDREPLEGVLDYGEYRTYSVNESRIAEEVVLTPLLANAESTPVADVSPAIAVEPPWWPSFEGVPNEYREIADAIVEQLSLWEEAIGTRNLNGIMAAYATSYEDPQGWGFPYVRRAHQTMLERWRSVKLHRQIRRWDFANYASTGQVNVLLYCKISGIQLTDSLGIRADLPVSIPRSPEAEVWVSWSNAEGVWRIVRTNPAFPNFREILSYEAGPYDNFPLGPDQF
jgi:hypothetical protein